MRVISSAFRGSQASCCALEIWASRRKRGMRLRQRANSRNVLRVFRPALLGIGMPGIQLWELLIAPGHRARSARHMGISHLSDMIERSLKSSFQRTMIKFQVYMGHGRWTNNKHCVDSWLIFVNEWETYEPVSCWPRRIKWDILTYLFSQPFQMNALEHWH